ncbi:hypothetical protein YPPY15_2900 [Yersinia pestis PY-15]|nr:hypothetical protein YPPY02_2912 [Yersinia pestis PY-02]EIR46236.1 hypothetical protein YPPY15_2900 [Yersinia pestis PY-15]EIS17524.1 hypothetical protein YPPY53_2993 [Yersinia pestis PY-53]EIS30894.1 hypothetical protein YPPY56_2997 [Yersinia pestis PY-56]EIS59593.1 hypothetical protein YPPY64_3020 [Yersinia pestis PY-64]EIS94176.1 hypothetical protein YPPY89_3154 [Yersinia pestis PY-89]EIT44923.1 hypothetical protein YPPY101_2865 [Yersinia pestis PY-101]EIT56613.1 hypothetical protein Y
MLILIESELALIDESEGQSSLSTVVSQTPRTGSSFPTGLTGFSGIR